MPRGASRDASGIGDGYRADLSVAFTSCERTLPATSSRWPPAGSLILGCLRDEVLDSQNRRLSAAHSPPNNANRRRVAFVGQCHTTAECDAPMLLGWGCFR